MHACNLAIHRRLHAVKSRYVYKAQSVNSLVADVDMRADAREQQAVTIDDWMLGADLVANAAPKDAVYEGGGLLCWRGCVCGLSLLVSLHQALMHGIQQVHEVLVRILVAAPPKPAPHTYAAPIVIPFPPNMQSPCESSASVGLERCMHGKRLPAVTCCMCFGVHVSVTMTCC